MTHAGYHRRAGDPPDAAYPHGRAHENDKVSQVGDTIIKWLKPVVPFIMAFVTWFMATIWGPIHEVPNLTKAVAILIKNDSISMNDRTMLRRDVNVMGRILCFNLDRTDRAKYDIDCGSIPLPVKENGIQ